MTYEQTYYFSNEEHGKEKETIIIVINEQSTTVYNFKYNEIDRLKNDEDTYRIFDKDKSLNANIYFQNLVDHAKGKYKFYRKKTSQTYDTIEIK